MQTYICIYMTCIKRVSHRICTMLYNVRRDTLDGSWFFSIRIPLKTIRNN